jgi:REP element-mobilizing transposase RayT
MKGTPLSQENFDRYWLLTSTTYGTWLPGDRRGFVSPMEIGVGPHVRHNRPGTPYDQDLSGYVRNAARNLKCAPIFLSSAQAETLLAQFRETARIRGWRLFGAAVMASHVHIVVGVPGDPEPESLLRDFKCYGSLKLNKTWTKPASGTWWTESGSKRKLPTDSAVVAAVEYVRTQERPLALWIAPEFGAPSGERGASAP